MTDERTCVTLTVDADTVKHALAALDALAEDRREPERYRRWYAEAATDIRFGMGSRND